MSKITGFYDSLKKSTKITVLSCGSFVVMTLLILAFFIIFPITPSEKIMTNIGRENMASNNSQEPVQSGIPTVETTVSTAATTKATTTKTTATRTHTSFTITLTTGSGFSLNGRIPTGGLPGYTETVTTPVDPSEPYTDPSVDPNLDPTDPNVIEPTDPNVIEPTNPNQGGDPPAPTVTPDPVVTPDPSVTPDPNQGGNAGTW